jgi:hypothetical protein
MEFAEAKFYREISSALSPTPNQEGSSVISQALGALSIAFYDCRINNLPSFQEGLKHILRTPEVCFTNVNMNGETAPVRGHWGPYCCET